MQIILPQNNGSDDNPGNNTGRVGERLRCCVVVPTYNNVGTLEQVLLGVARHVTYIIVVNDGSTDHTVVLLSDLQNRHPVFKEEVTLDVIHQPVNSGKGKALQKGFERAVASGFRYTITIDSDGQHDPDDIPLFVRMIEKYPNSLIVGARNMQQDGIPGKSSFGNRFSNFWYKVETGIKLPDTQSGYRLYPVRRLDGIHFFTNKYEFEIEVLVRAAWAHCRIRWIPVKVYYAPKESRVSHFRPFRDFVRISMLNTVLVLCAFFWIKPRDFIRNLHWRKIKRFFRHGFVNQKQSSLRVGLSAGFGVFMGIVPIWGYQLLVGLTLAHIMRLNKTIVFITANISIPPMIPLILYLSFLTGGWIIENNSSMVTMDIISMEFVKHNLYQYLVGSVVFAVLAGLLITFLVWSIVAIIRRKR